MQSKIQKAMLLAMAFIAQSAIAQVSPTIKFNSKISNLSGNFGKNLHIQNHFGRQMANIGDLNGDDVEDLAVCAEVTANSSKDGGIYILFMNGDGTVKSKQLITQNTGGLNVTFPNTDYKFGYSVAKVADLDGDGVIELAVGALNDNNYTGAVWILFMKSDGTVKGHTMFNSKTSGLTSLGSAAFFGHSIASPGDLDNDGNADIVVGAPNSFGQTGNAYTIFLKADGTVKSVKSILGSSSSPIPGTASYFGNAVASVGDIDSDGIQDVAIGSMYDSDGSIDQSGALYLVSLKSDGSVKSSKKWSNGNNNMPTLAEGIWFGSGITSVPDQNGDGRNELLVGAYYNSFGGVATGSAYLIYPDANYAVDSFVIIDNRTSGMNQDLENEDFFGRSVAFIKANMTGDNPKDYLVIGTPYDDDSLTNAGALYLFETTPQKISAISESPKAQQIQLKAYPNPAHSSVQLTIPGSLSTNSLSYSITDMNGKQASVGILSANGGSPYLIDLAELQAGVYFVRIQGKGFVGHTKIVKQ